ncbi:hypothetical protein COV20_03085 [Candidatus Woesearchaeota archaeon CG10_big_fil_rev_8_21_14_0_10_45_16]|nr:MAG: hypothetical protein COV20_03085 [Candidatus Woesearchaeota archaeon CG10_big_fil_rev_8_21_14_0_10_45_16]
MSYQKITVREIATMSPERRERLDGTLYSIDGNVTRFEEWYTHDPMVNAQSFSGYLIEIGDGTHHITIIKEGSKLEKALQTAHKFSFPVRVLGQLQAMGQSYSLRPHHVIDQRVGCLSFPQSEAGRDEGVLSLVPVDKIGGLSDSEK